MRAHGRALAGVARAALCAAALAAGTLPGFAQQARPQSAPAVQPRPNAGAPCFEASDPAAIAAGCDIALRAPQGTYTSDQTGLALQRRGGARAALGRVDEAIADFRQMAAAGYKVHEAYASIGSLEFRRQRLAEAEASYREALRVNPSYALALIGLGHTLIGLGRPAEAVPHFDRALATADGDAGAHLGKGTALLASGDLDGAIRSLDTALNLDPRLLPALYQRAQAHHDKGDVQKALRDADAAVAVATGAERIPALSYRGRLRNNAKNYDGAIADCALADTEAERLRITDSGLRSAALVCLGLARQSKGELAEAQRSYDGALRWNARDVTALSGRGYVVLQRGRFDAAIADFEAALRIDPRFQDALRFLGLTYSDKGDRAKAEEAFARAIEADPKDPWPIMIRAMSAARNGERERALADAARALALTGPQSSDALLVRGAVYYFLEDLDKARIDVDASIRLNPDNGQAHQMLSRILIRNGRLDEAQRALEASARLLPNDATVMLQRGLIALARRDFAAAQREFNRSLEINDAFAEPFAVRGQALEGQGLTSAALADYRTAEGKLAIDPDGRRAKALARERIAALTGVATAQRVPAAGGVGFSGPQGAAASPSQPSSQGNADGPSRDRKADEGSLYCRLVEGVFVHSRRYTGVEFDLGCGAGN
jgi:tetratricopeptide (TPR) repeat protein